MVTSEKDINHLAGWPKPKSNHKQKKGPVFLSDGVCPMPPEVSIYGGGLERLNTRCL